MRRGTTAISVMVLGAMLSGCGGGGVGSTPTPTPTPAPTYTPIASLTGNQTFQTAGITFDTATGGAVTATGRAFGAGIQLSYVASTDSYTLTAPDGVTVSVNSGNISPVQSNANQTVYDRNDGVNRDVIFLTRPMVNGVALSYVMFGSWNHLPAQSQTPGRLNLAVGGVPTVASDMPRSGTADYDLAVNGSILPPGSVPHALAGQSTGSLSVNFGGGTLTTSMTLRGSPPNNSGPAVDFGTVSGTATLASGGPGFSGTFASGGFTGTLSGAFFGPQGQEAAYVWTISGNGLDGRGINAGRKR